MQKRMEDHVSNKMERLQRARRVLSLAQEEAERMQHSHIGTEHLSRLMREEWCAGRVLRELGSGRLKSSSLSRNSPTPISALA